jgi:NAD(P)-dependent dehydrogenase (short-subunit alcohol dehydrogenase family)
MREESTMGICDLIKCIDLSGQVAIVTGGGRGLGKVYAQWLARAGAAVAVMARTASEIGETATSICEAGGRAIAVQGDVTEREAIEHVVAQTEEQLGPVNLLVNNAGLPGCLESIGPMWINDADEWWRCMDVNVRGPLLCSQAVLPGMIARCEGRIINASSGGGNSPWVNGSAYSVSKAALTRLTENTAAEIREHGIKGISVFAISPGLVRTPMAEQVLSTPGIRDMNPGFVRAHESGMARPPEDGAALVVYLASGRADALSGRFISVGHDLEGMIENAEDIQQGDLYTLRLRV